MRLADGRGDILGRCLAQLRELGAVDGRARNEGTAGVLGIGNAKPTENLAGLLAEE